MRYPIWPADPARLSAPPRLRRFAVRRRLSDPLEMISPDLVWAMLQTTVLIAMLLLVSGAGRPAVRLDGVGDPAIARAVAVLIGDQGAANTRRSEFIAAVPSDFVAVMGYRPGILDVNGELSLAKPIGACSSPIHLAFDMEPTCKGHDFGYDLLRYAAAIGHPLGDWARPLIDHWWYAAMHERCDLGQSGLSNLACHSQVMATEAIINVNTWREGYGPPIEENPWRYLGAFGLLLVTLLGASRVRPRNHLHPARRLQVAPHVPVIIGTAMPVPAPATRATARQASPRTTAPRPRRDRPIPSPARAHDPTAAR